MNEMPNGGEHDRISPEVAAANARARMEMKGVVPAKEVQEQRAADRLEEIDTEANPLKTKLATGSINPAEKLILEGLLNERSSIVGKYN